MKNFKINVTGKVQGVFFRKNTKEQADKIGIKGWVRNEADGSVFIEAEGEESEIKVFIEWCKKGPTLAIVSDIKIIEGPLQSYSSFEVRE